MSLLNDASLILVPSAIKTGEVLVQKPLPNKFADETGNYDGNDPQGSANLTFTRASSATRVGPDGLIEKVRTNLALYSEQFDNANWIKLASSVTANAGTAPDGTTTADKIIPNTSNTNHLVYSNVITSAGEYSFSVYVKASGYSKVALRESQSVGFFASFDLTSETILDSSTDQNNTITSVGDGWFRITSTRSYSGGITLGLIPLEDSYTSGSPFTAYAGDGTSGIFAWGAQMEFNVPTQYIGPTTTAAVSVGPVSGLPRLDYLGGATCGKLLLEGQRTNLNTYSDNLYNAVYVKQNVTISANNTTSPSGYVDADKIVEDTANTNKNCRFPNTSLTSGTTYNVSFFAKPDNCDVIAIREGAVSGDAVTYKFSTGTTSLQGTRFTSLVVTDYANGFKRISVNFLPTSTASHNFRIQLLGNAYNQTTNTNAGTYTYLGDGVSGVWAWGCTVEAGSYSTSYVNTLNSAVTRGADNASKTGISSLIGQTEGTLYWEGVRPEGGNDFSAFGVSDGTTNNEVYFRFTAVDSVEFYVRSGGSQTVGFTYTGADLNQNTKIAFAYKANDVAVYVNGVQVLLDSSVTVPASLTKLNFSRGNDTLGMIASVSQALLFKTRLSNAKLAELTTL